MNRAGSTARLGLTPMRIGLMGVSVSTRNRGVLALERSLVKLLRAAAPGAELTYLIGHHSPCVRRVDLAAETVDVEVTNYRFTPRSRPAQHVFWIVAASLLHRVIPLGAVRRLLVRGTPWLRDLARCDFVGDVRGGDSFSDIYGLGRFLSGSVPAVTAILLRRPLALLPQTYGPYRSPVARRVARFILRRADWIFSRDRAGVDEAAALAGRTKRPIRYCPDVAFCLDVKPVEAPRIDPPLPAAAGPSIMGLNVNGLMFSGGYTRRNMFGLSVDYPRFVTLLVRRILEDESARLLLVPHTFGPPGDVNSDPDACQAVMAALDPAVRPRVHLVAHAYDEMSLKAIIGRCGFFIGSRMHSCIAALSQGIPTVGIAYSDKFHGIFESVGVADMVVDARRATQDEALDRILTLYRDRERRRPALASGAAAVREQIARTFESLVADVVRGERACG